MVNNYIYLQITYMNTTLKGDIFEERVYNFIKELLDNDEYYLNRNKSQIYKKKAYYSERRKSNIICDISIESYIGNADEYSNLNIIECKHLNKNVTPDDIEEFDSKIRQIGEHDTKGTLVSSKGFAKSTINIAKSLKISLLLIKTDNQYEWINYRKEDLNYSNINEDIKEPFLGIIENKIVTNIADFLLKSNIIDTYRHKEKYINIKYVKEEKLEEISARLYKYDIHDDYCLNVEKLCAFLESKYNVEFDLLKSEHGILGKIEFHPLKISINSQLDENRLRYTLCHEIGHLILHSKILNGIDKKEDNDVTLSLKYHSTEQYKRRLEFQANIFASHLLLPTEPFKEEVGKYMVQERIYKTLYLDNQPTNQILVFSLIKRLSDKFKASNEAVKIRLKTLNLLKDTTDFSFKKLLKDNTF